MWKIIKDCPGYEISDNGEIRKDNKIFYGYTRKDGYIETRINNKCYKLHRLLAEAFIPNPNNKPFIDHINGIRNDNRIENLRWVTHKENMNNPLTIKSLKNSSIKHAIKYSKKCRCIETGEIFDSASDARRKYKNNNIASVLSGKRETAAGYHWEYVKE